MNFRYGPGLLSSSSDKRLVGSGPCITTQRDQGRTGAALGAVGGCGAVLLRAEATRPNGARGNRSDRKYCFHIDHGFSRRLDQLDVPELRSLVLNELAGQVPEM